MKIITNNHWHNFLYGYELTEKELQDFDYIDSDDISSHSFIRYRGYVIDPQDTYMVISEAMKLHDEWQGLEKWHGYGSDSFFSGTLIRYSDDFEQYQIATYIN